MDFQDFLKKTRDRQQVREINMTDKQIAYVQQIADQQNISFEDAGLLLINLALQHVLMNMADQWLNPN